MQKLSQVFNRSLTYFVYILLAFIPLYPKIPIFGVSGTFVAIRLEDILVALFLLLWAVCLYLDKKVSEFFKDRLNRSILLFFGIGALSLFSAFFLTHTIVPHLGILHWLRRVEVVMLLPAVMYAIRSKREVIYCLSILTVATLLVNLYAVGQQYLDWPVISTTNSEFSKGLILRLTPDARVNSTFAGHYDLAVFLVMIITLISAFIFWVKNIYVKIYLAGLLAFSFIVLVMTAARLSFIAVIAGVILALILVGKKYFILLLFAVAILAVVYPSQLRDRLVSTFVVNIAQQGTRFETLNKDKQSSSKLNIPTLPVSKPSFLPRSSTASPNEVPSDIAPGEPVNSTELGVFRSFEIRLNSEWPRATRAFIKNPFLGTGYSSLELATDNDFLRALGETGLLGTSAFILLLMIIFKRLWKRFKSQDNFMRFLSAAVLAMFFAVIVNGLFIDVFEASKIAMLFWIILGLSLGFKKNEVS